MLPWDKSAVFDFSHRYGVPYFRDTTPAWSTRGKLRRHLMPLLEEVFGEGVPRHLSAVGADADQIAEMVRQGILEPFFSTARWGDARA